MHDTCPRKRVSDERERRIIGVECYGSRDLLMHMTNEYLIKNNVTLVPYHNRRPVPPLLPPSAAGSLTYGLRQFDFVICIKLFPTSFNMRHLLLTRDIQCDFNAPQTKVLGYVMPIHMVEFARNGLIESAGPQVQTYLQSSHSFDPTRFRHRRNHNCRTVISLLQLPPS